MFVYNVKLSKTNIFKAIFIIVVIILIIFFAVSAYRIFSEGKSANSSTKQNVANITANNYTNILKAVHDDLDTYVGQSIKFSGYIYRAEDFTKEEFVLARDMIIDDNKQTLIVGFLCNCKDAEKFSDKTWVEITGTITKGNYHGEMPVIKIKEINAIDKPSDEYVYPPDDCYIPTADLYYDED